MTVKAFVVWDRTTEAIADTLESVRRRPPAGFELEVPMLSLRAGEILRDVIVPGILGADKVIVIADHPNANVGFEIGLAYCLGRDVAFMTQSSPVPGWLSASPLTNSIVHPVDRETAIKKLIEDPRTWTRRPADDAEGSQLKAPGEGALFLCTSVYEGETYQAEQRARFRNWRVLPTYTFGLRDLPNLTRGIDKLVWIIAPFPPGADQRDGTENAANGVIAGWMFAEILRRHGDRLTDHAMAALRDRFFVFRSNRARQVVDVQPFEKTFAGLSEYERLLEGLRPAESVVPEARSAQAQTTLDALSELLASSLTADGVRELAGALRQSDSLLAAVSRLSAKRPMIDALVQALGVNGVIHPSFAATVADFLPGSGEDLQELCARLVAPQKTNAPPVSTEPPGVKRLTAVAMLSTAHRLDRTTQWGQVIEQCFGDDHCILHLRGETRQGLGLFLERLRNYLVEKTSRMRVFNVAFRIEHEYAQSASDWERRLSHAIARGQQGTATEHLRTAASSVSVFIVLGLQPLHDLNDVEKAGLHEFLSKTYPELLIAANPVCPIRLLVPVDHYAEDNNLCERVDAAALKGEVHYDMWLGRQRLSGVDGGAARSLKYVRLSPVTFPTWSEVEEYLAALRPRPAPNVIAKIQADFVRATANQTTSFRDLADRLDRHLGEI